MKIIITGADGQLGRAFLELLLNSPNDVYEVFPYSKEKLDITDAARVEAVCAEIMPDIIINCAAFTKVDLCEIEIEKAYLVNSLGAYHLGKSANRYNAKLVHISTDYVFSGEQTEPYKENDPPNPKTIYGKSKLLGEELLLKNFENLLIVRTAWLYGHGSPNFVYTMLKLAEKNGAVKVVNDQMGSPSYTMDVAQAVLSLLKVNQTGIYHVTNEGVCSWYDFAKEIMRNLKVKKEVMPISSEEYEFATPRPSYSVLASQKLNREGIRLRDWQSALADFIQLHKGK